MTQTGVGARETGVGATKTMGAKLQTIFCVAGIIVPAVRTLFSFETTTVFGIKTVVGVIQTVFTATWTAVTAPQKIVSFA